MTLSVIEVSRILPESTDAGASVCVCHGMLPTTAPVCWGHVVRVTVFHVEKTDISTTNCTI